MDVRPTIDLRSDTVTLPTTEMREAMARAVVGDDVFGEDPTVRRLEEMAAERMGKEAAVFLTSGTLGNLIGVVTHCRRGDEVLVGAQAHIFWYEAAGTAVVGGIQLRTLPDEDGAPHPAAIEQAIRPPNIHFPRTAAVCLENTHNRQGGLIVPPQRMSAVVEQAHARDIPVHLDGARIFNASVALGMPASQLAAGVDSVTFCLSKGLAAPVGSLLCGARSYVDQARKLRKMLGGGMRQAGIIAAAGVVALEGMIDRLADDHANAKALARGLAGVPGLRVELERVQTNIVIVEVAGDLNVEAVLGGAADLGVRCTWMGGQRIRLVTHYGIDNSDVAVAIQTFKEVMPRLLE